MAQQQSPSKQEGKDNLKDTLNEKSWPLFTPTNPSEADEISKRIEEKLIKQLSKQTSESKFFDLSDIAPFLTDGIEVMVEDEFSKCFTSPEPDYWNWNAYLYPAWLLGTIFRYCFLFPMRLLVILFGTFLFAISFAFVSTFVKSEELKQSLQRKLLSLYCMSFVVSWSGVIKYHGVQPLRRPNQIFVANHTTVLDTVILQQHFNYAIVGQKHTGIMGFVQKYVLRCMGCLWFNRTEAKDRLAVAQKIKEHIQNPNNNPLLVFPEGVCVNNDYCVMFKKGAFELGAVVYPIAIKYNKLFVDAFWNSRKESFIRHIFRLMTSWAVVCDVWYLEPQTMRPNENPTQFANRVKAMIAKKAGLINVHWDGYLKYFRPSSRFMETKQRIFAQTLKNRIRGLTPPSPSLSRQERGEKASEEKASEEKASEENSDASVNNTGEEDKGNNSDENVSGEHNIDSPKLNGTVVLRKSRLDVNEIDR
jgi:glycerol-3-phosphate O-acyltransferase 3/4